MKGAKLKKQCTIEGGKAKAEVGKIKIAQVRENRNSTKKTKKNDTQQALQKLVDSC